MPLATHSPSARHRCRPTGQEGFAVIIALSLMSFVLLIVLSLVLLATVETTNAENAKARLLARENARLGLMIALGELQKHAGPDQRVTARADILGGLNEGNDPEGRRFWTGIWDIDNPSAAPRWLVSGDEPTLNTTVDNRILGPESAGDQSQNYVSVPSIQLENTTISWWVSDEGTKANLAAGRDLGPNDPPLTLPNQRASDFQIGQGVGLEGFDLAADLIVNATDGTINDTLSNLFSKRQLGLIATASSDPQSVENRFTHDISLSSYSVFQKPGTGGLKENIADQGIMTASPLGEAGWKLLNAAAALDTALPTPAPSEVAEGEAFFEPLPIPTEIALYIGFFHTRSDARIRIRYHLETELWNPYSRNLRFPRDASDNRFPNRALYVEFVNMPNFRVEELPGGTEPPVAPIIEGNMDMMFSGAQSLIEDSIHSWVEIQPDTDRGRNLPPGMLGGEIYRALEPNPNSQAQGLARSVVDYTASPNLLWSENQSQRPPPEATIRLTFTPSDTGNPEIIIREWNVGDPKAGRIIARYQNLPFFKDEFDQNDKYVLEKGFETGPNPFSRATSNTYLRDDYNLAFHVRLASDENEPGALKHIFSTLDLRDRTIDYSENFVTAEEQTISMSDLIDSVSWNPVLAQQLDSDIFSDLDLFATDRTNEHGENLNPIIAFDIPTRNAASLSVFKALPFRERKAFSLGSPWGGSINDLFDDYYFGTDPTLPNQAKNHRIVDLTKDSESATTPLLADRLSSALLAGGFNINSTSARAWSAIFGLLLRYQNGGELEVTHAFFRTPLYAAAEGKAIPLPFVTGGEDGSAPLPPADQQYNLGSRRLSSDQLRALGEVTAAAIRDREEPFLSVADFINSGILQQAIDLAHDQSAIDSNGFTGVTAAEDPINPSGALKYSHAYLTQNDIISRIGHMLTHRSDTFTIRVSASSTNPLNGQTLGEATLEATVQRFPDKMDGSDPKTPTSANEITDNRTFRLVNLKWIEGSPGI